MNMSQTLRLAASQRLSHEQRLEQSLAVRLRLIHALQGEEYVATATCPTCRRIMNKIEILEGFTRDPNDFTTQCTNCKHRFPPKLSCRGGYGSVEVAFYCDIQTQTQLTGLERLAPEEFRKQNAALFHSAIFHNASLKAAFARLGIEYPHMEVVDPMEKVKPFLGEMPDTEIARITGLNVRDIRRERRSRHIDAYRVH